MRTRLWNHVSTFSNLSGERLHQIYSKLKHEQGVGMGSSQLNGSAHGDPSTGLVQRGIDMKKFEAWKTRRRSEADSPQVLPPIQHLYQRPVTKPVTI